MSLKDKIKSASDRESRTVTIPEWDVTVEVRSPTVRERSALIESFSDDDGKIDYTGMYTSLLIATVYDPESGEPAFTADDAEMLSEKSGTVVNDLFEVAQEVSGLAEKSVDRAKKSDPV